MASANNFSVFLETLARSSDNRGGGPSVPSDAAPQDTQALAPVLTTLLKYSTPVSIAQLAEESGVNITSLVLSLLRLQESGVVAQDASKNSVVLTEVGRQMLNVGKMIR